MLYPETLVGRQPVALISMICAVVICGLAGGRQEPLALPGLAWAAGVIIYPILVETRIATSLPELAVLAVLVTGIITTIARVSTLK